jgi:regulator of protease activity HflC (stomatin/prohibitin superfamily)
MLKNSTLVDMSPSEEKRETIEQQTHAEETDEDTDEEIDRKESEEEKKKEGTFEWYSSLNNG